MPVSVYKSKVGASGAKAVSTYQAASPPAGSVRPSGAGGAAARCAGAIAHHASHNKTRLLHIGASQPRTSNWAAPVNCSRAAPTSNAATPSDSTSNCHGVGVAAPVRGGKNSAARRPSRNQRPNDNRVGAGAAWGAACCSASVHGISISAGPGASPDAAPGSH